MTTERPKTLRQAVDLLMWLQDQLLGIRLDRDEVQARYKWSESTLRRRLLDGTIPKPIPWAGRPMWRLGDLAKAEFSGHLPPPVSA